MPSSPGSGPGTPEVPSREDLAALAQRRDGFELGREADDLRRRLHGTNCHYALVFHLDLASGLAWCPVCGEVPGGAGARAASADPAAAARLAGDLAHPSLGDLHVLVPPGLSLENLLELARVLRSSVAPGATFQIGTATDWIAAQEGAGVEPAVALADAVSMGLRVLSDGVRPSFHPATQDPQLWEKFWMAAGQTDLSGGTPILYGAGVSDELVVEQVHAVARLQAMASVFSSVAPVIHNPTAYGGVDDTLRTQGLQDLRVLALCRLGLPHVPHVRLLFNRSDLKMAHTLLSCGADDLEGHLFPVQRDLKQDTESNDLSVVEAARWLEDAGFTPVLRNGTFDTLPAVREETA